MTIPIVHLLWIVPVSGFIGFMTAAIIASGNDQERR